MISRESFQGIKSYRVLNIIISIVIIIRGSSTKKYTKNNLVTHMKSLR